MLGMPASIKRDLRNLSKGDLIKIINGQHHEVMLKNEQIEEAFAQVNQVKEMSTKLKNEYEIDLACARLSNLCAQNAIASAPNSHVIDEELSQGILEENSVLKCELEGVTQNLKALEKELFDLKNEMKKPKHRLVSTACGFEDTMKATASLDDLRSVAKKANIELLVVLDKRNNRIPQKIRFSEIKEN